MKEKISKFQAATAIAVLFHTIGIVGLLFFDAKFFLQSTPVNLLLMFVLLIWTQCHHDVVRLVGRHLWPNQSQACSDSVDVSIDGEGRFVIAEQQYD